MAYDEQVIPTLSKQPVKKGEQGAEGGEGGEEEGKVEEITSENMKYAEPLIPVIGEEIVKKMFSRPWAVREEGLKQCEDLLLLQGSDPQYFQAGLSAAGQAMADKIA